MTIATIVSLFFGMSFPQSTANTEPFASVRFFVGHWQGTGTGVPGDSTVERDYEFVLGGKFLQVKNVSHWAPRDRSPKGEIHEDFGLMSNDKARKRIVFRQFHVEGFVNQYALEPVRDSKTWCSPQR